MLPAASQLACDKFLYGFKVAAYGRAGCGAAAEVGEKRKMALAGDQHHRTRRAGRKRETTQGESGTLRRTWRKRIASSCYARVPDLGSRGKPYRAWHSNLGTGMPPGARSAFPELPAGGTRTSEPAARQPRTPGSSGASRQGRTRPASATTKSTRTTSQRGEG